MLCEHIPSKKLTSDTLIFKDFQVHEFFPGVNPGLQRHHPMSIMYVVPNFTKMWTYFLINYLIYTYKRNV